MAARNRSMMKHASRFFSPVQNPVRSNRVDSEEFDEADIWGHESVELGPTEMSNPIQITRAKPRTDRRGSGTGTGTGTGPASLPVNIPDWSKILGNEYKNSVGGRDWEVYDDDVAGEVEAGSWVPPHEMVCRNRAMSFSVHEGVGRTLKGRDLRRVRNAIWEKTGFQD
ncbi:protein S40-4-like [Carex rostrata]